MLALRPVVQALQSLAFTLRGRALALVRAQFPVIRRFLTLIGYSVALIGHVISLVSNPLASRKLPLPPCQSLLASVRLASTLPGVVPSAATAVTDHDVTLAPQVAPAGPAGQRFC